MGKLGRPRSSGERRVTAETIKTAAQRQMAERGTAGLSLRAIARQMDITAPAIYNYFPRLEDLITALIVDAFNALGEATESAGAAVHSETCAPKIRAVTLAYRRWAVEHPLDFQLIYGNPIPGYAAPAEVTVPLASRPFLALFELFRKAWLTGELSIPEEYQSVPAPVVARLLEWQAQVGADLPAAVLCLIVSGWGRFHGLILLELFHHSQALIGDPAEFYAYELEAFMQRLGLQAER